MTTDNGSKLVKIIRRLFGLDSAASLRESEERKRAAEVKIRSIHRPGAGAAVLAKR